MNPRSDGLCFGEEPYAVLAQGMQVAEKGIFAPGEREHTDRRMPVYQFIIFATFGMYGLMSCLIANAYSRISNWA